MTSPVLRARQTAHETACLTGLPIIAIPLLAEWHAPSIVLGHTPPPTHPPTAPGANSLTDLHTRATRCTDLLHHAAQERGTLLTISHTLLLGVLTHLSQGPANAFTTAATTPCPFAERRPLIASCRTT
ncbi:histidine phosphatase family protein [Streptomyces sp. 4F14]|uniref:histidine phosphatase family protein n=1 Tax=Streptomyces sp. 4F14 TaxID=3394380 RepID=UPI003A88696E